MASKTFLDLCQMTARESGTVSGTQPTTVTGQTGRLQKFVGWVSYAWEEIQNQREGWRWMQARFEDNGTGLTLTAGTAAYTAASFSLTRLAAWPTSGVTIYKSSLGRSDEGKLPFLDWETFQETYNIGVPVSERPVHYSISPAEEIVFGPVPDVAYVVRGPYRKSPQVLAADGDVPELPARFHELIAWRALILMAEHDEAQLNIATALRRARSITPALERDQLPRPTFFGAGPLA